MKLKKRNIFTQRKDNIPEFAKEFLKNANAILNKKITGFSSKAMQLLLDYRWPGNIREMKNVVSRAVLITDNNVIEPQQLSIQKLDKQPLTSNQPQINISSSLKDMLKQYENDIIQNAIEISNGNKTKAAKLLGVNIRTLHRRFM